MWLRIIHVFALVAMTSGCGEKQSASVTLPGEATVTMTVWPMFGLHRDWHRRLTIRAAGREVSTDLLGDTGWWRGSNLYLHTSGTYMLHEGQAGCLAFTTAPAAFVSAAGISCEKRDAPVSASADDAGLKRKPGSRFYLDLVYIGRFDETTGDGAPIRFIGGAELAEVELPDRL